ncbi:PglD-related sugar-binding protein [Nocardioides pantholopis]|uniref:PglD-related sugar-binding protein n=1 Tax=Nocardioides pantholopis TaxID=2483798 RepID=UPI001F151D9D|nr:acetyltransferase [Nocardioides pantholopis]
MRRAVRTLLLVTAGGLAREVATLEQATGRYERLLMSDDDPLLWGSKVAGVPVIGSIDRVGDLGDADLVVCAGSGTTRRALVARLDALGVPAERYARVVHPSVDVPPTCHVGAGTILLAHVTLTADVRLGRHVVAMPGATLTHDCVVEDFGTLCAGVSLGGGVHVGAAAYLGMNSCVREGLRVGEEAVLGMGAGLLSPLPAGETWVGLPARPAAVRVPVED